MANTKSARKAARQTLRRTAVNKSRRTEMRTFVRKVEEAIASKDATAAAAALGEAEPRLARAAQGIVHKNTASRKISRLTKRVKALAAGRPAIFRSNRPPPAGFAIMRSPMPDVPPDRLSVDPASPFHDEAALARGVGIRFRGVERRDVEEYCVSEGWIWARPGRRAIARAILCSS